MSQPRAIPANVVDLAERRPTFRASVPTFRTGRDWDEKDGRGMDGAPALARLIVAYVGERLRRGEIVPITAAKIRYDLYDFAACCGNRPLRQLGPTAVEMWAEHMVAIGLAAATRSVRLSNLRSFCRWLVVKGHARIDWTIAAPKVRRARHVPRDLTHEHFGQIVAACDDDRSRLVVWLAFGCGLRCVEIARLNVDDVDPHQRVLHVVGKGGHERVVPIPPPVMSAVSAYLGGAGHRAGVLVRPANSAARPLSPSRISHIGNDAISTSGVKVRFGDGRTMHGLRAAAASDVLDQCDDPRVAQELLGHANLATTSQYLRRKGLEKVRAANDARFTMRETA